MPVYMLSLMNAGKHIYTIVLCSWISNLVQAVHYGLPTLYKQYVMAARRRIPAMAASNQTHHGVPTSPGSLGITVVVTVWLWNKQGNVGRRFYFRI